MSRRSGPVARPKSMGGYRPCRRSLQGERGHFFKSVQIREDNRYRAKAIVTAMRQGRREYLFVYGSLLASVHGAMGLEERRVLRWNARLVARGTSPGRLHDLGRYPGLAVSTRICEVAHGEVWRIVDGRRLWPLLDAYEGIDRVPPDYVRASVNARLACGLEVRVWVYRSLADLAELRRVYGRWRP
jgi:gamma-glutamylcyclotransferase (GGCT)/AIG2-like uncharacterized protein YtfP